MRVMGVEVRSRQRREFLRTGRVRISGRSASIELNLQICPC